jgi:hypothetical protein
LGKIGGLLFLEEESWIEIIDVSYRGLSSNSFTFPNLGIYV